MDEKSTNQNTDPSTDQGTGDKRTFSQEDVNRIVQERLAKEKAKSSGEADFAKREQELARRELHMSAKELLSEKGLPVQLFEALNCTDRKTMEKSVETVEKYLVIVNKRVGVTLKCYQLIVANIIYTMPVTVLTDCTQG